MQKLSIKVLENKEDALDYSSKLVKRAVKDIQKSNSNIFIEHIFVRNRFKELFHVEITGICSNTIDVKDMAINTDFTCKYEKSHDRLMQYFNTSSELLEILTRSMK